MATKLQHPSNTDTHAWHVRRDHWRAAIVAVALAVKRGRGVRSAAQVLIEGDVPCWVSARVLSNGGATRVDDELAREPN